MASFKDYKYIGMPFHAVGFPQPVYSHLMGSNDGVNWDDLKSYDFGWRDTDIAYINGEFWTCTGTCINHTKDFENFTQVNCPDMGLKNLWASEFFQDNSGQWWFIYCGSETDVDYLEFKLYASKMYPEKYQIDSSRMDIILKAGGGYIDPNINYINGSYYLWCSKTSTPTQELHLFKSSNVLGPYDEIQTNIKELINNAGFTWDEAPEMLKVGGKYYLYSDPWNYGDDESKRNIYRAESDDLVTWTNMQRCNADVTMRHFTPLYIGTNESGSNNNVPQEPISIDIELWDGNPGTLNQTNQDNFTVIQKLIDRINQLAQTNPLFSEYNVSFDLQLLPLLNRNARVQFLNNANLLDKLMPTLMEDILLMAGIIDYEYKKPVIPTVLYFDKTMWNNYWQAVADDLNLITNAINQITGGKN
ncbi:MAG TPA: family 43 glycosylhydrolase [Candidatus Ligilactobacillus faecavium]|nr:family 43 glycosylhydrolase [Candidatus Ligilactobacillus faecavium]